jgi:hypothetical protein
METKEELEDNKSSVDFNQSFSFIKESIDDNKSISSSKENNINNFIANNINSQQQVPIYFNPNTPNFINAMPYLYNNNFSLFNNIVPNIPNGNNILNNYIPISVKIISKDKNNKKISLNIDYEKNSSKLNFDDKVKKQKVKPENEINVSLILSGKEKRTCIRIYPIPKKFSAFDMIRLVDSYLKTIPGKRIYNSIYVPLARKIGKNMGFAFINLVSPKFVVDFYKTFNGIYLKNCKKPCTISFSDNQNIEISNDPIRSPIIFKDCIKEK